MSPLSAAGHANPRFEEVEEAEESASAASTPGTVAYDTPSSYPWNPTNPYVPPAMPPRTPDLFSALPILRDIYTTATSIEQDKTVGKVLPLLSNRDDPLPHLARDKHIEFLKNGIDGRGLPSYMTVLDASRPWIIYWCLTGLSLLGVDVSQYRSSVISTFTPIQNATGGFGGGHGQMSHLAPTYAAVLSLASVGADALSIIDRRAMLRWLKLLKNPNGSFTVSIGGETDVRGIYCALTVISLLRLPTDGLLENTSRYLASCQTYEGGFAAGSGNEAHGGYTFCALAGLCILHPPSALPDLIDIHGLIRWLSARQYAPEGGMSGRTNKLVDGCYSTWIGGCWAFVEAAIGQSPLWNHEGLIRYILTATQCPYGGLRDKPGKGPDFYHTNYILLGLGNTQYSHYYPEDEKVELGEGLPLLAPFRWKWRRQEESLVTGFGGWPEKRWGDEEAVVTHGGLKGDGIAVAHPVFNIRCEFVEEAEKWAEGLVGF